MRRTTCFPNSEIISNMANFFEQQSIEWELNPSTDEDFWRFDAESNISDTPSYEDRMSKLNKAKHILSTLEEKLLPGTSRSSDENLRQVLNIVIDTISDLVVVDDVRSSPISTSRKSMEWCPPSQTTVVNKPSSGSRRDANQRIRKEEKIISVQVHHPKHRRTDTASTAPETVASASSTSSSPRSERKLIHPLHKTISDDRQHCYPSKSFDNEEQRNGPEEIFDLWYHDFHQTKEDVRDDGKKIDRILSKSPTAPRTSLPPPPPPLSPPLMSKSTLNDATFTNFFVNENVPCSVDVSFDYEDDCSVLLVDMDDFDDYTIDEVSFTRELAGYHEGCEPKIVDVVPSMMMSNGEVKVTRSTPKRTIMSSGRRFLGVTRKTPPPTSTPPLPARTGFARFVAARPPPMAKRATSTPSFMKSRQSHSVRRTAASAASFMAEGSHSKSHGSHQSHCYSCRYHNGDGDRCSGTMFCI